MLLAIGGEWPQKIVDWCHHVINWLVMWSSHSLYAISKLYSKPSFFSYLAINRVSCFNNRIYSDSKINHNVYYVSMAKNFGGKTRTPPTESNLIQFQKTNTLCDLGETYPWVWLLTGIHIRNNTFTFNSINHVINN